MDSSQQLACLLALISAFLLFVLFLVRRFRLYWAQRKQDRFLHKVGAEGEKEICKTLASLRYYKKILTNVYLNSARAGSLTEVDLILLTTRGVFVIESKNYTGWIYGDKDAKMWLKTSQSGSSFCFYNPILQNKTHVNAVMRALETDIKEDFHSVIVFGDQAVFKELRVRGSGCLITHQSELGPSLKRLMRETRTRLSKEDVNAMYARLLPGQKAGRKIKRKHLKQVKGKQRHAVS